MIPCYITIRDLVTWPKQLASQCELLGLEVILIDNDSTYPPCVEWLESCNYRVIRIGRNGGCYVFFREKMHLEQSTPYILTDCDLDISSVPRDVIYKLLTIARENKDIAKVGLSLEIRDVPTTYPLYEQVEKYERIAWQIPRPNNCYFAGIGATFALYLPERNELLEENFYSAVRLGRPYTAKHLPWYLDMDNLNDELIYFFNRCDNLAYYSSKIKRCLKEKGISNGQCGTVGGDIQE